MTRPTFTLDPGTGLVFGRSSSNPKAPVISGDICAPDGTLLTIALFKRDKTTKSGEPMYSVKIETAEAAAERRRESQRAEPAPTYRDRDTYTPPPADPRGLVRVDFGNGRTGEVPLDVAIDQGLRIVGRAS